MEFCFGWICQRQKNHKGKNVESKKQNKLTVVLFATYMLLLIGVIIFKLPFYSPKLADGIQVINLIPFQGSYDESGVLLLREIIYNIIIYMPLGIYICMLKGEWPSIKKVLSIIGLSLVFEAIQFIFAMGRSDITDVLGNTLGGIIGIAAYMLLYKILGDRAYKIVNILALVVTICVFVRFAHLFYLSHFAMMSPAL